ncbi:protein TOPLESS [Tanacetum coccineum]
MSISCPKGRHILLFVCVLIPAQSGSRAVLASQLIPNPDTLQMSSVSKSLNVCQVSVGTNVGDIGLWEVGSRDKLVLRNFKVWDISACSMPMQAALVKDPGVSVNRVIWSPDGALFGVAYSRHIVQIYSYHGGDDVRQHLEIDAHVGGVNDLAFSHPNKQLCVITCGDDKTIKVWDAVTGTRQYTFEGHDAPVLYFQQALDGRVKAGYMITWDLELIMSTGRWCTTMAYSADGTRLFSCGTSKDGESHIVEWNESEGAVKRTYLGFRKRSLGVVQFDTTKNRFLAAGDDFAIKYWDMDNTQLLTSVDADGGLPASPRIRFNKDGALLAVSSNENGIKILANTDGLRLLRDFENLSYDACFQNTRSSKACGEFNILSAATANGDTRNLVDVKPRITEELNDKSKISRLIYTNSGNAILALASNAIHLLWKWQRNDRNASASQHQAFHREQIATIKRGILIEPMTANEP